MGFFDKLKTTFTKGKLKNEQQQQLQQLLVNAISDGQITDFELKEINSFFKESYLTESEFNNLKSQTFENAVEYFFSDKKVTIEERNCIEHLGSRLSISNERLQFVRALMDYHVLLEDIQKGNLPINVVPSVVLQKDELEHINLPAQLLEERVVSREIVGRSHGASFRIMRGVSYRVGASRGRLESRSETIPISEGEFVITSKRLIFSGNKKAISADLSKLLDFQLYADGLQFSLVNRQKPVIIRFFNDYSTEVCGLLVSHIVNEM